MEIFPDHQAFLTIKQKSRPLYIKNWEEFLEFHEDIREQFQTRIPSEVEVMNFFTDLREEKNRASSTIWTSFSMLNACIKGKYGQKLQDTYPRLMMLLKSYDVDTRRKASIFEMEEFEKFIGDKDLSSPYWCVRKVAVILAWFGGLRLIELHELKVITHD